MKNKKGRIQQNVTTVYIDADVKNIERKLNTLEKKANQLKSTLLEVKKIIDSLKN